MAFDPTRRQFLYRTAPAAGALWPGARFLEASIPEGGVSSVRGTGQRREEPARSPAGKGVSPSLREGAGDAVRSERIAARMEALSRLGATPEGGISRTAGSDADLAARKLFAGWLEEAGLGVRSDFAGNLIGRLEGADPAFPPLMTGSHLDSVPDGGNFDGVVGSVGALEAAQAFAESGQRLRHPLEVAVFFNEENGKTGSRALAGEVTAEEMGLPAYGGLTIGEALRRVGGVPERIGEAALSPGAVSGYLELHIEQGPVLDAGGIEIGAVEGIVGIRRFRVTVSGFANHGGTTAMSIRRDALVSAGRFIAAVSDETLARPGRQVATVGRIEARPGAPNVIPGEVELSLEIRDLRMETIESHYGRLREVGEEIAARNGTSIRFEPYYLSRAAPCDPGFLDLVADSAGAIGLSVLRMPSGAGHDAQSLAALTPIGMLFVPSRDGISHSPREFTSVADITNGTRVLAEALRRLDGSRNGA